MSRKKSKIFFSAKAGELLGNWCAAHSVELMDIPLIRFSAVESFPVSVPEIVFYSSPRSVEFSSTIRRAFPHALSAAIGASTATKLQQDRVKVHFTGETAGDPERVAKAFKDWVGIRKVLFPISDRSLGSVSSVFPSDQKEELVVYRTELTGESLPSIADCDYCIFTSPSNWQSFLLNNVPAGKIIAWGKSTQKAVNRDFSRDVFLLANPSEPALIELLEKLIK